MLEARDPISEGSQEDYDWQDSYDRIQDIMAVPNTTVDDIKTKQLLLKTNAITKRFDKTWDRVYDALIVQEAKICKEAEKNT